VAVEGFQYEMWSDTDKTLAMTYESVTAMNDDTPSRITVLLDENGDLLLEYRDVSTGTHPSEVYEDCAKLFPGQ